MKKDQKLSNLEDHDQVMRPMKGRYTKRRAYAFGKVKDDFSSFCHEEKDNDGFTGDFKEDRESVLVNG